MGCANINNKKGFSLAELVVVLALIAIVFACLILLVGMINKNIKTNQKNASVVAELETTKDFVEDWFCSYDNDAYSITSVESNKITLTNTEEQTVYLQSSSTGLTTSNSLNKNFAKITNVAFVRNAVSGLIKCTFTYLEDNQTFEFILNKQS